MCDGVKLSAELEGRAEKLAAVVLQRVQGHDDTALSQAKYIAFHKANSAGLQLEQAMFDAFLNVVRDLIERALANRAAKHAEGRGGGLPVVRG